MFPFLKGLALSFSIAAPPASGLHDGRRLLWRRRSAKRRRVGWPDHCRIRRLAAHCLGTSL